MSRHTLSCALTLASTRPPPPTLACLASVSRTISSSPYGRTHVWKHRPRKLPNPVVPRFPQKVVRADGSTFVHWTTSPRSLLVLARDATNNPLWNLADRSRTAELENEGMRAGRLGRFRQRFADSGAGAVADTGVGSSSTEKEGGGAAGGDMGWVTGLMEEVGEGETAKRVREVVSRTKDLVQKKKK